LSVNNPTGRVPAHIYFVIYTPMLTALLRPACFIFNSGKLSELLHNVKSSKKNAPNIPQLHFEFDF